MDRSVARSVFKFVLYNDELYQRTVEDLLCMCLTSDQARVAMGQFYKVIYSMHQWAPMMK